MNISAATMDLTAVAEPRFHAPSVPATRGRGTSTGDAAMDRSPVWRGPDLVAPPPVRDSVDRNDDLIIRLRMDGLSYSQIAREFGRLGYQLRTSSAQKRYFAARARQIPIADLPRPMPRPNGLVVAWAAGFFDGEGCVSASDALTGGFRRTRFAVKVAQVAREPLDQLAQAWGGTVSVKRMPNPRHQDQYWWQVGGRTAGFFLEDILPYLHVKTAVARLAIPFLLRTHGKGYPYTEAELEARHVAVVAIQSINSPLGYGKGRHRKEVPR